MARGLKHILPHQHIDALAHHPELFISYSSTDLDVVTSIADALNSAEISFFFGSRDIGAGKNFALEIVQAISRCDVFLLLLSEAAGASAHVRREVALAIDEGREILPISLPKTKYPIGFSADWTYWLSAVQVVPFVDAASTAKLVAQTLRAHSTASVKPTVGARDASLLTSRPRVAVRGRTTPSSLLRPELDAIPLIGRDEELLRLGLWATDDDDFDVRLLTGGAGQGKSRIAHELGRSLQAQGWTSQWVHVGANGRDVIAALPSGPVLLVIDYAESRGNEIADLLSAVEDMGLLGKARMLLLARSRTDWWRRLRSRCAAGGLLDDVTVQDLAPLVDEPLAVEQLYKAAVKVFTAAFRRTSLGEQFLHYRRFSSALDVIQAALADVLVGDADTGRTATARLLSRERQYAHAVAVADGLTTLDIPDLDRFSALFTIFGASGEDEAVALLACADGGLPLLELRKVARLFHRLYPGSTSFIDGLRPAALAADFIAELIDEDGGIVGLAQASNLFRDQPARLRSGLTTLTHSAAKHAKVRPVLRMMVDSGGQATLLAAVTVAAEVEDASALVDCMIAAVEAAGSSIDTVELLRAVPSQTVNLATFAATLADKVLNDLPPAGARNVDQAGLVLQCSNRFSDAGWGEQAAATAREAISDLANLSGGGPAVQRLFAGALSNFSNRLWEIGKLQEALAPAEQAVKEFARASATAVEVAAARNNLAFRLIEAGELTRARDHGRDAEEICRQAIEQGIHGADIGLASALNNLTCAYVGLGAYDLAAAAGLEAVSLRRSQAQGDRDRFLPNVARALANAAPGVHACGDRSVAETMITEARALHVITGRSANIFRYEEVESTVLAAVMQAVAGEVPRAANTLEEAAAMLLTLENGLGDLVPRIAQVIECNRRVLAEETELNWVDVMTVRNTALDALGHSTMLVIPQLLEFKDL